MNKLTTYYTVCESPHGEMLIAGTEEGLTHLSFQDGAQPVAVATNWVKDDSHFKAAQEQLEAYFYSDLSEFELTVNPQGTEFQRQVWVGLQSIPCGETVSYKEQAERLGQPTAARAVASANGRNPIAVVIPCHRVIGSDGKLRGYAGGLDIKAGLLALEQTKASSRGGQLFL